MLRPVRAIGSVVLALLMLFFGYVIADAGVKVLRQWPSISIAFAACGFLWTAAGPAMLAGGAWVLGCLGRKQTPLWIAGISALVAGGSLTAGVLTYVIPCSGPD